MRPTPLPLARVVDVESTSDDGWATTTLPRERALVKCQRQESNLLALGYGFTVRYPSIGSRWLVRGRAAKILPRVKICDVVGL